MKSIEWNCPICGNIESFTIDEEMIMDETVAWMKTQPCNVCYTKKLEKERRTERVTRFYQQAEYCGFPVEHAKAWRSEHPARNTSIETFITLNPNQSLWIAEKNQIGKTFAVLKCGLSELKRGTNVKWIESGSMFRGYVDALRESEKEAKQYFQELANKDLLIIDDIEKIGKFTNSAGELLLKLIDRIGVAKNKRIWVTSNLSTGEFQELSDNQNQAEAIVARIANRFLFWNGEAAK